VSKRLDGVHPKLVTAVEKIQFVLAYLGHPMMVTDGVRTLQQQIELYAQGRTAPGRIVTNADGIRNKSNHQMKDDGWGHAVDMTFIIDGRPAWPDKAPWKLYGEVAKACGCNWGGDWSTPDRPHIELRP
jgi:peptidoglycan L-alanyl-D-glutamate endopeptidase CwlK